MSANTDTAKLSRPLTTVAIVILIGFALLLYHMYQIAPTKEEALWNRSLALFGSVEAIAFTAAGYLFGKEVHREQAQTAERRANEKTAEAVEAKVAAAEAQAKGLSLRRAIEAKQPLTESLANGPLNELATLAQSLFP